MNLKAFELLEKDGFEKEDGSWYELTSSIDKEEGLFLHKLITESNSKKSLEIGCAEGISSLVICESIGSDGNHTILDPFQSTDWDRNGVNNLKKAGFNNFTLYEERSEFALPRLAQEGNKYDFVFVDGWHTFDHVLVEFFYIDRMLNIGGIVAFDDVALAGLNKLMRFISNYPNYECIGSVSSKEISSQRKKLNTVKRLLNSLFSPLGTKLKQELLNDTVVRSDASLKLDGNVTAFKKTANDERGWAWYEVF